MFDRDSLWSADREISFRIEPIIPPYLPQEFPMKNAEPRLQKKSLKPDTFHQQLLARLADGKVRQLKAQIQSGSYDQEGKKLDAAIEKLLPLVV